MPEWLIERGIGEIRAALIDEGRMLEARIHLEGVVAAGAIIGARLVSKGAHGRNSIGVAQDGTEYLLPRGAPEVTEGAAVNIEVTRERIPGSEPWKRPLAKVTQEPIRSTMFVAGRELAFPAPRDELASAGWDDVVEEARSGIVRFPGGELRISTTPAMTLIDVDGDMRAEELALAGARKAAGTIQRLGIGGSIGIDLPTVASKTARQAAAAAIDTILPQPFERTAVNGFGFVQIVRSRRRASLLELAQDRAAFEARALLRHAACEAAGAKRLVAHPQVVAVIAENPDWIDLLSRQVGGKIELRAAATVPISGGYAESV